MRLAGSGVKDAKKAENSFNLMSLMYQAPKEEVIARAMKLFPLVQKFDSYLAEIVRGQADATLYSLRQSV